MMPSILHKHIGCALVAALMIHSTSIAADTPASPETASLPSADGRQNAAPVLPRVLSESDAALYRDVFVLQDAGKWRAADKLIAKISDPLLMGHVQYQRYMHSTAYRSKYAELKKWTVSYADHPGAMRVYKLALRRQPKGWRAPKRPVSIQMKPYISQKTRPARKVKRLSATQRRLTRRVTNRIKSLVRRERPTQALELLDGKSYRGLNSVSYDRNLAIIARGYYHAGLDAKALDIAERAIKRSGANAPYAHWWAGLAAWRMGEYRIAANHFGGMAQINDLSDWSRSGAAFWAARASLVGRDPVRVAGMLQIGAQFPHTFYGLLSLQARDGEVPFDWTLPELGAVEMSLLDQVPTVRRALALIEADQAARSESELKRLTVAPSPELTRVLLSLIGKANLPNVAIRLGYKLQRTHGERYDSALFPVPGWTPNGGFDIDKALIFAFMRQESRFKPDARSHRGASGLMQLMPATAQFIARKRTSREALFDPAHNIALGQKYIRHLLEDPAIGSNLFYATTAYNAGPGNLRKWLRKVDHRDDPLLFIESVRSRETRNFVERVLTNFWIYRLQLGQETPSLAAVAAGEWPVYIPLDPSSRKVSRANK